MLSVLRSSVAVSVLVLGMGFASPAFAQSAAEVSVRMGQLEEQMRQLTGQVEQLSNQVRLLKAQLAAANPAPSSYQTADGQAPLKLKKVSVQQVPAPAAAADMNGQGGDMQVADTGASDNGGQGIEQIQDQPLSPPQGAATDGSGSQAGESAAPGPAVLGALAGSNAAAKPGDGGYQGEVLVSPSQQDAGADAGVIQQQQQLASAGMPADGATAGSAGAGDGIQPVALGPDTPEALYERSNESLLRRQFGDAEVGFRTFLQKYPDHALAGSAQYWLGETYYAQNQFRQAAQAFLQGYRKYPDGRRAADSLLKLGISLNRLGQTQQACAAFASVDSNYPKAVEARRRAQAEARRANCAS
jgi:tol-pal system protein YbgF